MSEAGGTAPNQPSLCPTCRGEGYTREGPALEWVAVSCARCGGTGLHQDPPPGRLPRLLRYESPGPEYAVLDGFEAGRRWQAIRRVWCEGKGKSPQRGVGKGSRERMEPREVDLGALRRSAAGGVVAVLQGRGGEVVRRELSGDGEWRGINEEVGDLLEGLGVLEYTQ